MSIITNQAILPYLMPKVWDQGINQISELEWNVSTDERKFAESNIKDNRCKHIAASIHDVTGQSLAYKTLKDYFIPITQNSLPSKTPDSKTIEILCAYVFLQKADFKSYTSTRRFIETNYLNDKLSQNKTVKKINLPSRQVLIGLATLLIAGGIFIFIYQRYFTNYQGEKLILHYYTTLSKAIALQNENSPNNQVKAKALFKEVYNLLSEVAKQDSTRIPAGFHGENYGGLWVGSSEHTVKVIEKLTSIESSIERYAVVYVVSEDIPPNPLTGLYKEPLFTKLSIDSIHQVLFDAVESHYTIPQSRNEEVQQKLLNDINSKSLEAILAKGYIKSFGEYQKLSLKPGAGRHKEDIYYFCMITLDYQIKKPKIHNIEREIIPR